VADRVALEDDWEARLRAAASDDGEQEYEWGARWWGEAAEGESEDAYAARVYTTLEARAARARAGAAGATAAQWRAAGAGARRGAPPPQAPPPQPTPDWREAAAQARPTALRAVHEAAWAAFARAAAAAPPGSLPPSSVPIPSSPLLLLAGEPDPRRAARAALLTWHPDKFGQAFGSVLAPSGKDALLARVGAVARALTEVATRRG